MRASVVEMISASVGIATGGSIGPSILEVFNTLLKHLKISVDFMNTRKEKPNVSIHIIYRDSLDAVKVII